MQGGKHTAKAINAMMHVTLQSAPAETDPLESLERGIDGHLSWKCHSTEVFSNQHKSAILYPRRPRKSFLSFLLDLSKRASNVT